MNFRNFYIKNNNFKLINEGIRIIKNNNIYTSNFSIDINNDNKNEDIVLFNDNYDHLKQNNFNGFEYTAFFINNRLIDNNRFPSVPTLDHLGIDTYALHLFKNTFRNHPNEEKSLNSIDINKLCQISISNWIDVLSKKTNRIKPLQKPYDIIFSPYSEANGDSLADVLLDKIYLNLKENKRIAAVSTRQRKVYYQNTNKTIPTKEKLLKWFKEELLRYNKPAVYLRIKRMFDKINYNDIVETFGKSNNDEDIEKNLNAIFNGDVIEITNPIAIRDELIRKARTSGRLRRINDNDEILYPLNPKDGQREEWISAEEYTQRIINRRIRIKDEAIDKLRRIIDRNIESKKDLKNDLGNKRISASRDFGPILKSRLHSWGKIPQEHHNTLIELFKRSNREKSKIKCLFVDDNKVTGATFNELKNSFQNLLNTVYNDRDIKDFVIMDEFYLTGYLQN